MRDFRLLLSLTASALLAGCAGPATKPAAPVAAHVVPAPAPLANVAPQASPERAPGELDRLRQLAPDADPGVLALALQARACAVRNGQADANARLALFGDNLVLTREAVALAERLGLDYYKGYAYVSHAFALIDVLEQQTQP